MFAHEILEAVCEDIPNDTLTSWYVTTSKIDTPINSLDSPQRRKNFLRKSQAVQESEIKAFPFLLSLSSSLGLTFFVILSYSTRLGPVVALLKVSILRFYTGFFLQMKDKIKQAPIILPTKLPATTVFFTQVQVRTARRPRAPVLFCTQTVERATNPSKQTQNTIWTMTMK